MNFVSLIVIDDERDLNEDLRDILKSILGEECSEECVSICELDVIIVISCCFKASGRIKIAKSYEFAEFEKEHHLESSRGKFEWLMTKKKNGEDGLKEDKWEKVLRYTCNAKDLSQQQITQLVKASKFVLHHCQAPTQLLILLKGDKDVLSSKFVLNLFNQLHPNGAEKCRFHIIF